LEMLKAAEVDDRIRQVAETIYQTLIEAELTAVIGAHPHQRTGARSGMRNGHRPRRSAQPPAALPVGTTPSRTVGARWGAIVTRHRATQSHLKHSIPPG
jgi:putative transposase